MPHTLSSKLVITAIPILLILITSFSLITSLILSLITHVAQTRPHQTFTTAFYATTASTLETNISLQDAPLRSPSFMQAHLHLTLPESVTNLNHPVFTVCTTLYSTRHQCVAHTRTNAAIRFRSSTMRSLRAIVFAIPIMFGFINEYQTVNVPILQYTPSDSSACLHRINIVLNAPLHVYSATVIISVRRSSFIAALASYMPFIIMATITFTVVLSICAFCFLSVVCLTLSRMFTLVWATKRLQNDHQVQNVTASQLSMRTITSQTSATTDTTAHKFNNALQMGTTSLSLQPPRPTTSIQAQTEKQ